MFLQAISWFGHAHVCISCWSNMCAQAEHSHHICVHIQCFGFCAGWLAGWMLLRQTNFIRHSRQKSILNFIMRLLGATTHIMNCLCTCALHERRDVEVKRWHQIPYHRPMLLLPARSALHCKKSHKNTNKKLSEKVKDFSTLYSIRGEIGQPNAWHLLPIVAICS